MDERDRKHAGVAAVGRIKNLLHGAFDVRELNHCNFGQDDQCKAQRGFGHAYMDTVTW